MDSSWGAIETDPEPTYLGIGIPIGVAHPANAEGEEPSGQISNRGEIISMHEYEYAAWLAFLQPQTIRQVARQMAQLAREQQVEDVSNEFSVSAVLRAHDELRKRGLLLEWDRDKPLDSNDGSRLSVTTAGLALGNSPEAIDNWRLADIYGREICTLGTIPYYIWSKCAPGRLLSEVIQMAATDLDISESTISVATSTLVANLMGDRLIFLYHP